MKTQKLTKKQFSKLYYNNTNDEVAEKLGVSVSTIKLTARRLELSKGRGNRVNHKRLFNF